MKDSPIMVDRRTVGRCAVAILASMICVTVAGCARPASATDQGVKDDLAHLKDTQPSQSHTMMDVGFHTANMWFAGQAQNWPLARFYFNETRQHIRWTIRVRPVRKDPDGNPVDLKGIFDAIDASTFETLKAAIEKKDGPAFEARVQADAGELLLLPQSVRPRIPAADGPGDGTAAHHQPRSFGSVA